MLSCPFRWPLAAIAQGLVAITQLLAAMTYHATGTHCVHPGAILRNG